MRRGDEKQVSSVPPSACPLVPLSYRSRTLDGIDPPPLWPPAPREAPLDAGVERGDDVEGDEEAPLDEPESPNLPDRGPKSVSPIRRSVARLTAPRSFPDTTRGEIFAPVELPTWFR